MESENEHIVLLSFCKTSQYENTKQDDVLILADRGLAERLERAVSKTTRETHRAAALPSRPILRRNATILRRTRPPDISAIDNLASISGKIRAESRNLKELSFDLRSLYN